MEVEEFVLEDEGDYGVYLIDGQIHESNTSKLSYSWGIDKGRIKSQFVEPGVREVIREIKKRNKVMSQDEAISIALRGIKTHKEQYTVFGTEMHKAFQSFDESKPLILPTAKHQAYFQGFLYFRKQPTIKPILVEKLLVCPHCGITTQIDNFSDVDGQNTVMDYKTGRTIGENTPFQLAINKHVLENLGYLVERTWAVHIQDFFGYPIEVCAPWGDVELRLRNADLKRKTLNPKIYPREFSGEKSDSTKMNFSELRVLAKQIREHTDKEKKEASAVAKTSPEQESAHDSNIQGHQFRLAEMGICTKPYCIYFGLLSPLGHTCHGLEDKSLPETVAPKRPVGRPRRTLQTDSLHTSPSANISKPQMVIQEQTPPEEVELDLKHVHPKRLKRRLFQQAA